MKHILVTGGAGYIGSHTVLELLNKDYRVTIVDNLCNSSQESIKRVSEITGKSVDFYNFDLRDKQRLTALFQDKSFDAVIHFAGLKAVGESVAEPLKYYDTNLVSTLVLCEVMQKHNVKQLIFSSSATVYGDPIHVPIGEAAELHATNPYGQTKLVIEHILKDLSVTNEGWRISLLRYFNPIGAHESGKIGEDPNGIPNNLLPFVAQVAIGKRANLKVYGDNYPTADGTGVRDYIHVVDLAKGHIAALDHPAEENTCKAYNLGSGIGSSVLEVVKAFEIACGKKIPYEVVNRRSGDIAACYADPSKAKRELAWQTERTLEDACRDAWRWQVQNPNGYKS